MLNVVKKLVGTSHDRKMKKIRPIIEAISALEPMLQRLTDVELKGQTAKFREQLDNGASLDDIMPEVYATVRETSIRTLGIRQFDVQFIGGVVLHTGCIAEMKTGEGKTLVAVAPAYLNALEGKGVHIVTVNDYLAARDAEWMSNIYNFLGMEVGVTLHGQERKEKQKAYRADITYGQNNEFGFDYLRDNMKFSIYDYVQKALNFAIVDEVDSILIDEARTPLIISGQPEESSQLYTEVNGIIPRMRKDTDFIVDEKGHSVTMTEEGVDSVEGALKIGNLFDPANIDYLHHINQALKAHYLYKRDVNYMVTEDREIVIVDEFTGRTMPGRRWSDGLHQAVEAKENVPILEENRTLATISFQNLFRLYNKLAGMTGTADTEAEEFHKTYKLDVTVIPTNWPCVRDDSQDVIYKSEREKFYAITDEIRECIKLGQPVLVGTASVEKSEAIHRLLERKGVPHNVLNAKQHEREAYVVAQAGRKSSVTVSTNMAGRGTDIILGGNPEMMAMGKIDPEEDPAGYSKLAAEYKRQCEFERTEVIEAGGLHILGTERHESRRIDNQLRGRSGRQGDPGSSRFFLSLEDDLLRIFGADRLGGLMTRLGMEEGVPIEHKMVTRSIENAQKKVEHRNFDTRKHLLEYDDVMNQQRKTIYALRKQVLEGKYMAEEGLADVGKVRGDVEAEKKYVEIEIPQIQVDRFTEHLIPILERTTIALSELGPPPPAGPDGALPEPTIDDIVKVNLEILERQIYAFFGYKPDLSDLETPRNVLDRLIETVPRSVAAQRERLLDDVDQVISDLTDECCHGENENGWNLEKLGQAVQGKFAFAPKNLEGKQSTDVLAQSIYEQAEEVIASKEKAMGMDVLVAAFRHFYLREVDKQWLDHLAAMDHLRAGIGLRGYGNRDPKQEYKREGYDMFTITMNNIKQNVIEKTFHVQIESKEDVQRIAVPRRMTRVVEGRGAMGGESREAGAGAQTKTKTVKREAPKVGRNDPCPCGSGKKYKKCCGAK
ncbi:MAG: preprotein translocase subunit SecA [Proteobacteria bacterium]|nr:preprotein translocase subunit SecA [Pseudomonadota bacterium]